MMDLIKAKLEAIMDTKMDGLKGEIMEGLKKFLIERPHESDNVSHEIHDEDKRKMNQDSCWITERGGESVIEKFKPFQPYNASVISV
jgi:hypothetical protein